MPIEWENARPHSIKQKQDCNFRKQKKMHIKKEKRTQSRDTDGVIIRRKGIKSLQKHVDVFIYTIHHALKMSRSLYPSRSPVSYAPSTVP